MANTLKRQEKTEEPDYNGDTGESLMVDELPAAKESLDPRPEAAFLARIKERHSRLRAVVAESIRQEPDPSKRAQQLGAAIKVFASHLDFDADAFVNYCSLGHAGGRQRQPGGN